MNELAELLLRVDEEVSLPRREAMIMEWALAAFRADGAALFVVEQDPAVLATRLALGSLSTTAPLLAAELSRMGIPTAQGVLPLTPESGGGAFFCRPLNTAGPVAWSALVLHGEDVEREARVRDNDLREITGRLRDLLAAERKSSAVSGRFPGLAALFPDISVLTDGLGLPLYVCDSLGRFTFASIGCLGLAGYSSLDELARRQELFPEPGKREAELDAIRKLGRISAFPLVLTSGSGARLHVLDSAVSIGESIVGLFFDVTELTRRNAELKDALQVQELLNDSILEGSKNLERTQGAAIRSLARLAEYRDPETGFHLQRMQEFTRLIATEVHLRNPYSFHISLDYAKDISLSSMLHDIGKVSIPDRILGKPGKLDPAEWEIMKKHTVFGWEVLHKADRELGEQSFLTLAATIALSHHERYDGSGYPNGTVGEQIPLSARISAVADVYDALSTVRPYKEAWTHERTTEEIFAQSGKHFDPALVEIFRDMNGEFDDVRRRFPAEL